MKKFIILLLALVLTASSFSQETQKVSSEKNVLKVNTLALIFGTGSIFYERAINDLTSAELGIGYLNYSFGDTKFSGFILTPEFRIYPRKDALDGFYISPYLRYQNFSLENKATSDKGTLTNMGGGVAFGRQWITKSGFTLDLFFGGHYGSTKVNVDIGSNSFDTDKLEGFRPRIGFALGFAF
ncbi:MAG TPA: DUF3575 domain-containing protein [Bacteroidales bacterium]|nr:DUF3575 domain-containing protein [Bacteroidales bacterium]